MKILLVTDQFYFANNGMTISSRRLAAVLAEHGHEVRVLTAGLTKDGERKEGIEECMIRFCCRNITCRFLIS